jgi:hypothetical protein
VKINHGLLFQIPLQVPVRDELQILRMAGFVYCECTPNLTKKHSMESENLQRLGYLFAADFFGRHMPEEKWKRTEIEALAGHIAKSIRMTFDLVQESVRENSAQALAALSEEDKKPYTLLINALFETMDNVEISDPTLIESVERFKGVLATLK